jgi:sterol desaturase/sphingolipid hydroxylase (fatty acid hydroxylase superfamily)
MYDADYEKSILDWNARGKEAFGIALLGVLHTPMFPVAPYFTGTVLYACFNYIYRHKKAHLDPAWARVHMTGHYDHHMGQDQDANWCVTRPWFDWLVKTRKPYAFTESETRRRFKHLQKALGQALSRQQRRPSSLPPLNDNVSTAAA